MTDRVPFHFTDAELDLGREELHHHLPPPHRLHLALSQPGQGRRRRQKRPNQPDLLGRGGQEGEGRGGDAARDRRQGRLITALRGEFAMEGRGRSKENNSEKVAHVGTFAAKNLKRGGSECWFNFESVI